MKWRSFVSMLLLSQLPLFAGACAVPASQHDAKSVATPQEAAIRYWRALAAGDEASVQRAVVFGEPSEFVSAEIALVAASSRLHNAVRDCNVKREHVDPVGFDPHQDLAAVHPELTDDFVTKMEAKIRSVEWVENGDSAAPKDSQWTVTPAAITTAERRDDGWVIVLHDDQDVLKLKSTREFYRRHVPTLDAATAEVRAGRLRSMFDLNAFVKARMEYYPPDQ